jgi:hypothetical protein
LERFSDLAVLPDYLAPVDFAVLIAAPHQMPDFQNR